LVKRANYENNSLCNFDCPPVPSPLLGPNILFSILFSKILNPYSSISMRNQVSHPYEETGKIIILYILIFRFSERRWEDKRF
jgi:hypothetical protein